MKHSDLRLIIYYMNYRPNASPLRICAIDSIGQAVNYQLSTVNCQLSTDVIGPKYLVK
ncbi:MAG: hypothetical protein HC849_26965 [Oscillatoriales cyanobacterium RU_3_3]|nr:hypothetical protein [Oscillatoriales cyanobacterium RU_3_3]NJR25728.1 hypothetical protein [Richelia sp. CSU_2_1]